jgi:hypothetical protein
MGKQAARRQRKDNCEQIGPEQSLPPLYRRSAMLVVAWTAGGLLRMLRAAASARELDDCHATNETSTSWAAGCAVTGDGNQAMNERPISCMPSMQSI